MKERDCCMNNCKFKKSKGVEGETCKCELYPSCLGKGNGTPAPTMPTTPTAWPPPPPSPATTPTAFTASPDDADGVHGVAAGDARSGRRRLVPHNNFRGGAAHGGAYHWQSGH